MHLEELIIGCKKQDRKCQELLFRELAPRIYSTCRRYQTAYYMAQDLLQDTFIRVFEKIDTYDPSKGEIHNWICRIAINMALTSMRKQKTFVRMESSDLTIEADNTELLEYDDPGVSEEEIIALIEKLPAGYKAIFNLYVIEGLSHGEIAKKTGVTESTSKTQLFKAKKKLKLAIVELKKERYGRVSK